MPSGSDFFATLLKVVAGEVLNNVQLSIKPLKGGLEAHTLLHLTARYQDSHGRPRSFSWISKELRGMCAREADIYERLLPKLGPSIAPRLIASERLAGGRVVVHLEVVRQVRAWPWRDVKLAAGVLEALAELHGAAQNSAAELPAWNYEQLLRTSAEQVLTLLARCKQHRELSGLAAGIARTTRIVTQLDRLRAELMSCGPFASTVIHGDLHSGNVLLRRRAGRESPVFIDWTRTRWGSPLEDVSSWLQCLRFWEPEALRVHDTLLRNYLSARGNAQVISSDLRAAYWISAAFNGLSGALAYHLSNALAARSIAHRARSVHASADWLRVIRRADAFCS